MLESKSELCALKKQELTSLVITKQRTINRLEKELKDIKESMLNEFTAQIEIIHDSKLKQDTKIDRILKIAKRNYNELEYDLKEEDYIRNDEEDKIDSSKEKFIKIYLRFILAQNEFKCKERM